MHSQQHKQVQEQQTSKACSKNRRKLSDSKGTGTAAENNLKVEKNALQISNEHLQIAQKPSTCRKAAGSNWAAVTKQENVAVKCDENSEKALTKSALRRQKRRAAEQNYVAIDCEMVGVGVNGQDDMLARVSIVSKRGEVLLDKFVKPQQTVIEYRTSVSGIRAGDMRNGEDFKTVQDEVVQILQGKILVGHAVRNDLAVLHITHPQKNIRDTSRYKPLCRLVANGRTPSLKRLSQAILGKEIQTGEHSSVEDARAAMSIYNLLAKDWEAYIKRHQQKDAK